jgi:hypothetical protein
VGAAVVAWHTSFIGALWSGSCFACSSTNIIATQFSWRSPSLDQIRSQQLRVLSSGTWTQHLKFTRLSHQQIWPFMCGNSSLCRLMHILWFCYVNCRGTWFCVSSSSSHFTTQDPLSMAFNWSMWKSSSLTLEFGLTGSWLTWV